MAIPAKAQGQGGLLGGRGFSSFACETPGASVGSIAHRRRGLFMRLLFVRSLNYNTS